MMFPGMTSIPCLRYLASVGSATCPAGRWLRLAVEARLTLALHIQSAWAADPAFRRVVVRQ